MAMIEEVPTSSEGGRIWQTTGDPAACKFLVEQPGPVVAGCALMLAQERYGDLRLAEGPPQLVYSACGREPNPGEIRDCGGVIIEEAQVEGALRELRAALDEEK